MSPHARSPVRRLLAVLALLCGGLAAEAVTPVQCQLIAGTRPRCLRDPREQDG